jgi:hypothetical protein
MALLSWESLLIWLKAQVSTEQPKHFDEELTQADIRELRRVQLEIQLAREKHAALLLLHKRFML